jgi:hypothetical protein
MVKRKPRSTKSARRPKRTRFVPEVIFGTVMIGVVPACVVACGSSSNQGHAGGVDSGHMPMGVAQMAFDSGHMPMGVAQMAFDSGMPMGVAQMAFDSGMPMGVAQMAFDSGSSDSASDGSSDGPEGG